MQTDGGESGLGVLISTWRITRVFCVSKMNVLFTKFLQEQATEDTGTLLRSLGTLFAFELVGSVRSLQVN